MTKHNGICYGFGCTKVIKNVKCVRCKDYFCRSCIIKTNNYNLCLDCLLIMSIKKKINDIFTIGNTVIEEDKNITK